MSLPMLANRRAGLVLSFGGANSSDYARALAVDSKVNRVLVGIGSSEIIFRNTVYRSFLSLAEPTDIVELDIYLFRS